MSNNNMIHLGHSKYIDSAYVASISTQKSAVFRATQDGTLDGVAISELSEDALSIDAFILVYPKVGSPIGLCPTDEVLDDYAFEIRKAIQEDRDIDNAELYEYIPPAKGEKSQESLECSAKVASNVVDFPSKN
jgi:hypothetical protein